MATKVVGPVIAAAIAANAPAVAVLGARVCSEGGALEDEGLPYATYQVTSNEAERDLDGSVDGYFADATLTVTAATYDEVIAALNLLSTALHGLSGTYATVVVRNSLVTNVSDEPNGPIDSDDGEVFQGSIDLELEYV